MTHNVCAGTAGAISDVRVVWSVPSLSFTTTATGAHVKIEAMRHKVIASARGYVIVHHNRAGINDVMSTF